MNCVIRKITIKDIEENKYKVKDSGELAIAILKCGKVDIPLSEEEFGKLVDSINLYNLNQVSCSKCKYACFSDKDVRGVSCSLKAKMDGVPEGRLDRFNRNYAVNAMNSCQYNQPREPVKEVPKKEENQQDFGKTNIDPRMRQARAVPGNMRTLPPGLK